MNITSTCMIINLSISMWEGRRLDREASRKVVEEAHALDAEAARVNKLLISKEAFKEVQSTRSAMRNHFLDRTLPWKDNGDRLITRKMYQTFIDEHFTLEQAWVSAVDQFLTVKYPAERDRAAFRMAGLYKPDDYPRVDELRERFRVSLTIDPIAEAEDFRVKLSDEHVTQIQDQIREATERRIHNAMKDVWTRVEETVNHFMTRASKRAEEGDDGKRAPPFHESIVSNLTHLVDALPALNLVNDPDLKALTARLRDTLCGYDAKDLRKDPALCAAAAAEAEEIMDSMRGFMSAFK